MHSLSLISLKFIVETRQINFMLLGISVGGLQYVDSGCIVIDAQKRFTCFRSLNTISPHCTHLGAFTLLTSRFLKSEHFDPTIYTCAKNHEVSVSRNFAIFWLVVRMCDHRLVAVHAFMHAAHAVCMRAEDIDTRFKELNA